MNNIFKYVEKDGQIMITGLQEGVTTASIAIPETIDNMPVTVIAYQAFKESSITSIKIGGNIRAIDAGAFEDCQSLTSVIWNDHCKTIPYRCFSRCVSLSTFDFSSVESIHEGAFAGSGLQEANLFHNIQKVEPFAFQDCKSLVKVEWLSDESINIYTFANCENLKAVNISDQVQNIEANAFQGCPNAEFSFI